LDSPIFRIKLQWVTKVWPYSEKDLNQTVTHINEACDHS